MFSHANCPQINYKAQSEFLRATALTIWPAGPAPIDALRRLWPQFQCLWAQIEQGAKGPLSAEQISAVFALTTRTVSSLDDSPEARDFNQALTEWMKSYNFSDEWIRRAAICTLFEAQGSLSWCLSDLRQPPWRGGNKRWSQPGESQQDEDFLVQLAAEHREQRKPYVARIRLKLAMREPVSEAALWTARKFSGSSWGEIAKNAFGRHSVDDVKHRAKRFCRCAGLTLPTKACGRPRNSKVRISRGG